jgi:hypothetical protein
MRQQSEPNSFQRGKRLAEAFMLAALIGLLLGGDISRRNARSCAYQAGPHFLCAGEPHFGIAAQARGAEPRTAEP